MKIPHYKKIDRIRFAKQKRREHGTFKRCPNCGEDIEDGGHFRVSKLVEFLTQGKIGEYTCQKV